MVDLSVFVTDKSLTTTPQARQTRTAFSDALNTSSKYKQANTCVLQCAPRSKKTVVVICFHMHEEKNLF